MADGQDAPVFRIADLARYRAQEAKTLCSRKIEAVAKITDQLNQTPEEAAIFKPWVASMIAHHRSLRDAINAIGAYWNPVPTTTQEELDAKDIGYNAALAAIDVTQGWPDFPGWSALPPPSEAPLRPAPDELMRDWGPVGDEEAEAALTTDDLLGADDETQTDVIGKLSRQRRKRFTELLNVELAELEQSRGGPKEDRKREAKIQRLLGVFARVGEM